MTNIFHDPTKRIPENDPRIVRVEFDKSDIGARKSHLPKASEVKATNMSIDHVKG